jgi:septum site-determining protein MinD
MVKKGDMMSIEDIIDILAIDLIGVVPDDENIIISTNRGEPAVTEDKSLAGQAYRNVAKRIMGEEVPLIDLSGQDGFLAKVKKLFGFRSA